MTRKKNGKNGSVGTPEEGESKKHDEHRAKRDITQDKDTRRQTMQNEAMNAASAGLKTIEVRARTILTITENHSDEKVNKWTQKLSEALKESEQILKTAQNEAVANETTVQAHNAHEATATARYAMRRLWKILQHGWTPPAEIHLNVMNRITKNLGKRIRHQRVRQAIRMDLIDGLGDKMKWGPIVVREGNDNDDTDFDATIVFKGPQADIDARWTTGTARRVGERLRTWNIEKQVYILFCEHREFWESMKRSGQNEEWKMSVVETPSRAETQ